MPEQLQKILDRVVEWWKKFSNKQRMLLISLTAVVILALVILGSCCIKTELYNTD